MGCVGAVRAHDSRCMRGRTTSGTMHEVSFLASQFERASEPRVRFIAQFNLAREEAPQKKKNPTRVLQYGLHCPQAATISLPNAQPS